ncbi:hypothetical protein BJY00DRAFT_314811 [Aspergillus carlsbadensis]|nr:hypothetical protein BJY00DRAFT_314811 [Aspergillus carlsbadensis]
MGSLTADHSQPDGSAAPEHGEPVAQQRVYPEGETIAAAGAETAAGGTNESEYMNPNGCPPVAIVGMALRLPGGLKFPSDLWTFLLEKRNGVCEVPGTRYTVDSFYSSTQPRSVKTRHGYYLHEDPSYFDAPFFSINAHEAGRMDPQQRQLLEVLWECLESAGETNWRGKRIGCYVGVYGEDWLDLASKDPQHTDRYHILGTGQFALSNRLSYEFDFQGPSMTLQTGCSASLVGLHEACQALYSGDCSSAIVAGTNLMFAPTMTATMSDNTVMSPTGTCRTFDEKADGYGRGEGVNALYVKRLEDAIRDNDPIRAVIRATSTNCDGHTPSITTPGSHSQEALVRWAYKKAGIPDITQTGFFECHGTGTVAGDTAEASVVAKLFEGKGVVIGAVKPNVGHGEGASGISSVIKGVLSLEHKTIPPNVFFEKWNPNIPFEEGKLQVPVEALPWPEGRAERVSVNCFGVGGANAHAILDSVPSFCGEGLRSVTAPAESARLLVVSSRNAESLKQRIRAITDYANNDLDKLQDLAYTLGIRREHLSHRAFVVAKPNVLISETDFQTAREKAPELTVVFTGQGAQWPGMGRDLLDAFPSARSDIKMLDRALRELPDGPIWSLDEELCKVDDSRVNEAEFSQPLYTALQIALVNILSAWGIKASSVVGHSSGEIAAAYAAGAITAKWAIILAYYRGRLAKQVEGKGAMAAVGLGRDEVTPLLEDGVIIGCENSPSSLTLSGDSDAVDRVMEAVQSKFPDALCRRLRVSTAYHSSHMGDIGPQYGESIASHIEHNEKMVTLFSSVTSATITEPSELNASYWRRNLESPVLFSSAVRSILAKSKNRAFLEVGPHSALSGPLQQILRAAETKADLTYIPTLIRNESDSRAQLLATAGLAHSCGISVDLEAINGTGNTLGNLPPYPWQHSVKYWHDSRLTRDWRFRQYPHHEILGARSVESSELEPAWRNVLRLEDVPWISEHALQGNVIFPAAGYISMAGEAVLQLNPDANDYSIKNMVIKNPLLMKESADYELTTTLKPVKITDLLESEWYAFTVVSFDGTSWTKHCHGQVRAGTDNDHVPPGRKITQHARVLDVDTCYRYVDRLGFAYGPLFRRFQSLSADPTTRKASGTLLDLDITPPSRYTLHPAIMDHLLQTFPMAIAQGLARRFQIIVPAAIGHIYVRPPAIKEMSLEALMAETGFGTWTGQGIMMAGEELVLSMTDVAGFPASGTDSVASGIPVGSQIRWAPDLDFIQPSSLLHPSALDERYEEEMLASADRAFLYVLNTAAKVAAVTPEDRHVGWKTWITEAASKLEQEHPDCSSRTQSEREQQIKSIVSLIPGEGNEEPPPVACLRYIYENCEEIITAKTLSEETRVQIDNYAAYLQSSQDWSYLLSNLGHSNPAMRILEIGGGTGAATSAVLKHLKSPEGVRLYSSYTFTDAAEENLDAAKKRFADEDVEFKEFDVAKEVEDQGLELHSFDLVIASKILRHPADLDASLKKIHDLLALRGRLLLHDFDPEELSTSYIMGLLPHWMQPETRQQMPTLDEINISLRSAGFKGIEATSRNVEALNYGVLSVLSSVSPHEAERETIVLLTEDTPGPWAEALRSILNDRGYTVRTSTLQCDLPSDDNSLIISLLDIDGPYLHNMSEEGYLAIQNLLTRIEKTPILWVTKTSQMSCADPRYGLIFGFARTMRHEKEADFSIFETDSFDDDAAQSLVRVVEKLTWSREKPGVHREYEFSLYEGAIHVGRCHWISPTDHMESQSSETLPRRLDIESLGSIDTLRWTPFEDPDLKEGEVEIDMHYVGLNFRDILVALGLFGEPNEFGLEGSGVIRRVAPGAIRDLKPGDRVALLTTGTFRTRFVVHSRYCIRVPEHVSLEDAATMPSVYITACYCLVHLARLHKEETVLIHSACGGVGLAAIRVCEYIGATIYATVGSEEKVQYLMDRFNIPRHRIFNSRSTDFLHDVMRETNGRGVDVVLNSLTGTLLHASWDCLASFGRMIELGKRDFLSNGQLSMGPFIKNRAYIGFDLTQVGKEAYQTYETMHTQFETLSAKNELVPIRPVKVYEATEVVDAFRYMQQGVHMGKILVKMPEDPATLAFSPGLSPFSFDPDASYLLAGGLGGLGRSVSTWMVEQGARHLAYLSRSAGLSDGDKAFVRELETQGCQAICVPGDVTVKEDVERAVSQCPRPLAGVAQLSGILRDAMFDKMTHDEWTACLAPKVQGTWNLHNATQSLSLDFFILVGSVSGVCGTVGQANYAAANSFLGSFTTYRRDLGLPAGIVDLGAIEDVGMLAKNPELIQKAQSFGLCFPSEQQLIDGLKLALSQCATPPALESKQSTSCIIGLSNTKPLSNPNTRPLWVRHDSRFSLYTNLESQSSEPVQGQSNELRALLRRVEHNPSLLNDPESEAIVRREIGSQVTQRMAQAQDMDDDEIAAIAIDSLMAIEIRGWARRNLALEITLVQIAKAKTVGGLTRAAIEHLKVKYGLDETKGGDGEREDGRLE